MTRSSRCCPRVPWAPVHGPKILDDLGWQFQAGAGWVWNRPHDTPIVLAWPKRLFQHELRCSLRFVLLKNVAKRKDTEGCFNTHPNMPAVSFLLRGGDKKVSEVLQEFDNFTPAQPTPQHVRGCVRQVLAGSTRTADRLVAAQLWESDICPGCNQQRETPGHLFSCKAWSPGGDLALAVQQTPSDPRFPTPAFLCLSVVLQNRH